MKYHQLDIHSDECGEILTNVASSFLRNQSDCSWNIIEVFKAQPTTKTLSAFKRKARALHVQRTSDVGQTLLLGFALADQAFPAEAFIGTEENGVHLCVYLDTLLRYVFEVQNKSSAVVEVYWYALGREKAVSRTPGAVWPPRPAYGYNCHRLDTTASHTGGDALGELRSSMVYIYDFPPQPHSPPSLIEAKLVLVREEPASSPVDPVAENMFTGIEEFLLSEQSAAFPTPQGWGGQPTQTMGFANQQLPNQQIPQNSIAQNTMMANSHSMMRGGIGQGHMAQTLNPASISQSLQRYHMQPGAAPYQQPQQPQHGGLHDMQHQIATNPQQMSQSAVARQRSLLQQNYLPGVAPQQHMPTPTLYQQQDYQNPILSQRQMQNGRNFSGGLTQSGPQLGQQTVQHQNMRSQSNNMLSMQSQVNQQNQMQQMQTQHVRTVIETQSLVTQPFSSNLNANHQVSHQMNSASAQYPILDLRQSESAVQLQRSSPSTNKDQTRRRGRPRKEPQSFQNHAGQQFMPDLNQNLSAMASMVQRQPELQGQPRQHQRNMPQVQHMPHTQQTPLPLRSPQIQHTSHQQHIPQPQFSPHQQQRSPSQHAPHPQNISQPQLSPQTQQPQQHSDSYRALTHALDTNRSDFTGHPTMSQFRQFNVPRPNAAETVPQPQVSPAQCVSNSRRRSGNLSYQPETMVQSSQNVPPVDEREPIVITPIPIDEDNLPINDNSLTPVEPPPLVVQEAARQEPPKVIVKTEPKSLRDWNKVSDAVIDLTVDTPPPQEAAEEVKPKLDVKPDENSNVSLNHVEQIREWIRLGIVNVHDFTKDNADDDSATSAQPSPASQPPQASTPVVQTQEDHSDIQSGQDNPDVLASTKTRLEHCQDRLSFILADMSEQNAVPADELRSSELDSVQATAAAAVEEQSHQENPLISSLLESSPQEQLTDHQDQRQVIGTLQVVDVQGGASTSDVDQLESVIAPETEVPEVIAPETEVPEVIAPETEVPEVIAPENEVPEVIAPENEVPEVIAPENEVSPVTERECPVHESDGEDSPSPAETVVFPTEATEREMVSHAVSPTSTVVQHDVSVVSSSCMQNKRKFTPGQRTPTVFRRMLPNLSAATQSSPVKAQSALNCARKLVKSSVKRPRKRRLSAKDQKRMERLARQREESLKHIGSPKKRSEKPITKRGSVTQRKAQQMECLVKIPLGRCPSSAMLTSRWTSTTSSNAQNLEDVNMSYEPNEDDLNDFPHETSEFFNDDFISRVSPATVLPALDDDHITSTTQPVTFACNVEEVPIGEDNRDLVAKLQQITPEKMRKIHDIIEESADGGPFECDKEKRHSSETVCTEVQMLPSSSEAEGVALDGSCGSDEGQAKVVEKQPETTSVDEVPSSTCQSPEKENSCPGTLSHSIFKGLFYLSDSEEGDCQDALLSCETLAAEPSSSQGNDSGSKEQTVEPTSPPVGTETVGKSPQPVESTCIETVKSTSPLKDVETLASTTDTTQSYPIPATEQKESTLATTDHKDTRDTSGVTGDHPQRDRKPTGEKKEKRRKSHSPVDDARKKAKEERKRERKEKKKEKSKDHNSMESRRSRHASDDKKSSRSNEERIREKSKERSTNQNHEAKESTRSRHHSDKEKKSSNSPANSPNKEQQDLRTPAQGEKGSQRLTVAEVVQSVRSRHPSGSNGSQQVRSLSRNSSLEKVDQLARSPQHQMSSPGRKTSSEKLDQAGRSPHAATGTNSSRHGVTSHSHRVDQLVRSPQHQSSTLCRRTSSEKVDQAGRSPHSATGSSSRHNVTPHATTERLHPHTNSSQPHTSPHSRRSSTEIVDQIRRNHRSPTSTKDAHIPRQQPQQPRQASASLGTSDLEIWRKNSKILSERLKKCHTWLEAHTQESAERAFHKLKWTSILVDKAMIDEKIDGFTGRIKGFLHTPVPKKLLYGPDIRHTVSSKGFPLLLLKEISYKDYIAYQNRLKEIDTLTKEAEDSGWEHQEKLAEKIKQYEIILQRLCGWTPKKTGVFSKSREKYMSMKTNLEKWGAQVPQELRLNEGRMGWLKMKLKEIEYHERLFKECLAKSESSKPQEGEAKSTVVDANMVVCDMDVDEPNPNTPPKIKLPRPDTSPPYDPMDPTADSDDEATLERDNNKDKPPELEVERLQKSLHSTGPTFKSEGAVDSASQQRVSYSSDIPSEAAVSTTQIGLGRVEMIPGLSPPPSPKDIIKKESDLDVVRPHASLWSSSFPSRASADIFDHGEVIPGLSPPHMPHHDYTLEPESDAKRLNTEDSGTKGREWQASDVGRRLNADGEISSSMRGVKRKSEEFSRDSRSPPPKRLRSPPLSYGRRCSRTPSPLPWNYRSRQRARPRSRSPVRRRSRSKSRPRQRRRSRSRSLPRTRSPTPTPVPNNEPLWLQLKKDIAKPKSHGDTDMRNVQNSSSLSTNFVQRHYQRQSSYSRQVVDSRGMAYDRCQYRDPQPRRQAPVHRDHDWDQREHGYIAQRERDLTYSAAWRRQSTYD